MGKPSEITEARARQHRDICNHLHQVYLDKNADYGDAFRKLWAEVGFLAGYTKIADKFYRIQSLRAMGEENRNVKAESITDSLMDLANYCIMSIIEMDLDERGKADDEL